MPLPTRSRFTNSNRLGRKSDIKTSFPTVTHINRVFFSGICRGDDPQVMFLHLRPMLKNHGSIFLYPVLESRLMIVSFMCNRWSGEENSTEGAVC